MLRVLKLIHVSDRASDLGIAKMHHRQKFGVRPSLSLIGLDHDMSLMSVVKPQGDSESRILFLFSRTAGRTRAPSDFFLSHP